MSGGSEAIQTSYRDRLGSIVARRVSAETPGIGPGEGSTLDALVAHNESNDAHGTGVLLERVFADSSLLLSIRSRNHFGGRQRLGSKQLCLEHGDAPRASVYARMLSELETLHVRRILAVPYGTDDLRNAIALHDLHGAPMCTWIMDDQNVAESHVPDALMRELLQKSQLRLAISAEIRDAYEAKYGMRFGVVPPLVPPYRIRSVPDAAAAARTRNAQGAIAGHIWSGAWLNALRVAAKGCGMQLDWFCPGGSRFMTATPAEIAADGITFRGAVPEDDLVSDLRQRPFVVVPSGTLDSNDDRPAISRMSLPSRITFVLAATNTPMLVLGSPETAAARFVVERGIGVTARYEPFAIRGAVDQLLDPANQKRMRERAASMASFFSTAGVRDWLWRSLALGEPADDRFDALFPRRRQGAA